MYMPFRQVKLSSFIQHWDLNTGQLARTFEAHGAQAVAVQPRPYTPSTVLGEARSNFNSNQRLTEFPNKQEDGSSAGSDDDSLFGDDSGEDVPKTKNKPVTVPGANGSAISSGGISADVILTAYIDGTIRLWDRRSSSKGSRLETNDKCPPWCVSVSPRIIQPANRRPHSVPSQLSMLYTCILVLFPFLSVWTRKNLAPRVWIRTPDY